MAFNEEYQAVFRCGAEGAGGGGIESGGEGRNRGNFRTVRKALRQPPRSDTAAKLRKLINCIDKNRDGIENASKMDFYGSGLIEKAVDITIWRRFKKMEMSRYVRRKANPLLALRLLKLDGEWEFYWQKRIDNRLISP